MSEVLVEIHKTQIDVAGKSSAFFFLNQPLHASCWSPGDLDLVAIFSEFSLGCSDCCVQQKWFFFSNVVTRRRERERERGGGGGVRG